MSEGLGFIMDRIQLLDGKFCASDLHHDLTTIGKLLDSFFSLFF